MQVNLEEINKFLEIVNYHISREHYTFALYLDDKSRFNPAHTKRLHQLLGHFSCKDINSEIKYRWFQGKAIDLLTKANSNGYAVGMQASVGKFGQRDAANALYPTHVVLDYEIEEDGKQPEVSFTDLEEFIGHTLKSKTPPELIVRTSPGKAHFWWPLKEKNETQEHWGMWRACQDSLLRKYSSDRSCKDPSRVFRVPGFLHQKNAPHLAMIVHYQTVRPYSLELLVKSYELDLNKHLVDSGGLSINAPVMTKEQEATAKKYSAAANQTLKSDIDEYEWETPDQIRDMISYLPTKDEGEVQDWHSWVSVGTAICRKFTEKKAKGSKDWTLPKAKEIFFFFCERYPHYNPGKYKPRDVWKNCLDMASKPIPMGAPKHTLATIVSKAMENGWIVPKPQDISTELINFKEEEVEIVTKKEDGTVVKEKVTKKVAKKFKVDPALLNNIETNDFDLAQIVSTSTKDCLKYHNGIGWLQWNRKHWLEMGEDNPPYAVTNQVYSRLRFSALRRMVRIAKQFPGQKDLPIKNTSKKAEPGIDFREKAFQKRYGPLEAFVKYTTKEGKSEAKLRAVSKIFKTFSQSQIETDDLDAHDHLFCVANGVVDLTNGDIVPHSAAVDKMITKISPLEYQPDSAPPKAWLQFLDSVFQGDKELINFIQVAIGYSLTGSAVERCMFILHGGGRNGKSTFTNVIRSLFGYRYSTTMSTETLTGKTNSGQVPVGIAKLRGMRMASTTESDENQRLKEGTVKSLTGDDMITARFMRQNEFDFFCFAKIWFPTNHLPQIRGDDDGIWDRIKLISFPTRYYKEHETEQIEAIKLKDPFKKIEYVDKDLPKKLAAEAPAILKWAVDGAIVWHKTGLPKCRVIDEAGKEYRHDQDKFNYFIENFLEPSSEDDIILVAELRTICHEQTGYRYTAQKIKKIMEERGYKFKKTDKGLAAYGVKATVSSMAAKRAEKDSDGDNSYLESYDDSQPF